MVISFVLCTIMYKNYHIAFLISFLSNQTIYDQWAVTNFLASSRSPLMYWIYSWYHLLILIFVAKKKKNNAKYHAFFNLWFREKIVVYPNRVKYVLYFEHALTCILEKDQELKTKKEVTFVLNQNFKKIRS